MRVLGKVWAGVAASAVFAAGAAGALDALRFSVAGGDEDLTETLRAASLLIPAEDEGTDDPAELVATARAEYSRLVGALYANGYYGGTVNVLIDGREAASIPPLDTPGRIGTISVQVDPGPVYRFSQTRLGPVAVGTEVPGEFMRGKVAESGAIQDAVGAAVAGWRAAGNAKADLAGQEIVARHPDQAIAAEIGIAPGPRLRFGDLVIRGESSVSDRRIRKIASLPEGEVFDPEALEDAGTRLRRTGVFRSVALVEAEVPNPDGTLDITAQIVDLPPRRFGFGAEIQTVEGATLSAFWLHRNLLGGAERFRIEGEVSNLGTDTEEIDTELGFTLTRPATIDAETDAILSGRIASLNEETYSEDTATLGLGFERRVTDTVTARAGIEYRFSDVEDDLGQRDYTQLFFPLGATLDTREEPLDPVGGFYVDLEVAPFYGLSDSDSGARLEFDARTYRALGAENRTVVAARLQGGSVIADDLASLPSELRFYSGGGGTVRGQDYQSLGVDVSGGRVGGRNFLGVQSEIRQGVTENISVVGFYDWGFVGRDSMLLSDGDSHSGAGIGVRYATGIGPIRADLGFPVSGPESDESFQIYIGIGQAF